MRYCIEFLDKVLFIYKSIIHFAWHSTHSLGIEIRKFSLSTEKA